MDKKAYDEFIIVKTRCGYFVDFHKSFKKNKLNIY